MKRILTFGFILIFISTCGQADKSPIYGKWTETKRTLKNGETGENLTFDGKPYTADLKLEFKNDGTCIDLVELMTFNFKINKDLLVIGDRKYKIEKLTTTELVIVDYDPDFPDDETAFKNYFKKSG